MLQIIKLKMHSHLLGDDGLAAIAPCVTNIEALSIHSTNFFINQETAVKGFHALAKAILEQNKLVSYQ